MMWKMCHCSSVRAGIIGAKWFLGETRKTTRAYWILLIREWWIMYSWLENPVTLIFRPVLDTFSRPQSHRLTITQRNLNFCDVHSDVCWGFHALRCKAIKIQGMFMFLFPLSKHLSAIFGSNRKLCSHSGEVQLLSLDVFKEFDI